MRRAMAFLAIALLLCASRALAQESCTAAPGGTSEIAFVDSGDTSVQYGTLRLLCTAGTMPLVTVSGNGPGSGYDFSGTMDKGADKIPFTGTWDLKPPGAGGTPVEWTFTATATGLLAAKPGSYATTVTFTILP